MAPTLAVGGWPAPGFFLIAGSLTGARTGRARPWDTCSHEPRPHRDRRARGRPRRRRRGVFHERPGRSVAAARTRNAVRRTARPARIRTHRPGARPVRAGTPARALDVSLLRIRELSGRVSDDAGDARGRAP